MDERNARLVQAQLLCQLRMKLDYFSQAADLLITKGFFDAAAVLLDCVDKEVRLYED